MKKEIKIKKLPNYFLSAPQKKGWDNRVFYLWKKVEEIIKVINENNKENLEKEILIEVSRMIEKRTGF